MKFSLHSEISLCSENHVRMSPPQKTKQYTVTKVKKKKKRGFVFIFISIFLKKIIFIFIFILKKISSFKKKIFYFSFYQKKNVSKKNVFIFIFIILLLLFVFFSKKKNFAISQRKFSLPPTVLPPDFVSLITFSSELRFRRFGTVGKLRECRI